MAEFRSYCVFSVAFASALQHATLAAKRQVLDLGCGGGCWSLLLAGPRLHVTVVVGGAEAYMQVLRAVYALDARAHVTVLQSDDVGSPEGFLSVLKRAAAVQDAAFMGFEMVVMLDVLTALPPVIVGELCAALLPYVHTRSKALVSVLAMPASEADSATNWWVCTPLSCADVNCRVTWCKISNGHIEQVRAG
jgi:hypothetical protein